MSPPDIADEFRVWESNCERSLARSVRCTRWYLVVRIPVFIIGEGFGVGVDIVKCVSLDRPRW